MRRQFTPEQKAQVALVALRGDKTINQIASEFEINPTQVKLWRNAVREAATSVFAGQGKVAAKAVDTSKQIDELHRVIGIRDGELEWLKKTIHGLGR
jgi:transposase